MLCDHPLASSGVGTQSRFLIEKLVATGRYQFLVLGGAVKHESYDVIKVSDDITIVPVDGFGTQEMIRLALAREKPDALFIFNDPRFFVWIWEMEDEIHQICPIVYWHLWDQCDMRPDFNRVFYESTDLINCINWPTYQMCHDWYPEKTNFAPHGVPAEIYKPLPDAEVSKLRRQALVGKPDDEFVAIWVNRNAHRKRPADVIMSWHMFVEELQKKHGHKKATLLLHTNPLDPEGPNLYKVVEKLNLVENVTFSIKQVSFEEMNYFYNIADCTVNVSSAEGFGLGTLEGAYAGTPTIVLKTGGMTRQVINAETGEEVGIGLDPELRRICGSQGVPYIVEDHVTHESVAKAFMRMYELGPGGRADLGKRAREYVTKEFDHNRAVKVWDESLTKTIENYKAGKVYTPWELKTL